MLDMTIKDIFNWLVNTPILEIIITVGSVFLIGMAIGAALFFTFAVIYWAWIVITESIHIPEKPLKKKFGYKLGKFIGKKGIQFFRQFQVLQRCCRGSAVLGMDRQYRTATG